MNHAPTYAELVEEAAALLRELSARRLTVATAESCTGGLIAAILSEVPGSSVTLDRGYVTYSNAAKSDLLGVPAEMLAAWGAVSEPVARAMAEGASRRSGAGIALSVTGIAGPGGGSPEKPVGLVHLAGTRAGRTIHRREVFGPLTRAEIRHLSVRTAFSIARQLVGGASAP